jgi:hypothetical protein
VASYLQHRDLEIIADNGEPAGIAVGAAPKTTFQIVDVV